MKLADIPQRTNTVQCYRVDIHFEFIERWLETFQNDGAAGLDLNPDFQRGHVWTVDQRTAFMEFLLSGGETTPIMWNVEGGHEHLKPCVIVDGLQRLTTIRMFLRNEVRAFGCYMNEFEDIKDDVQFRRLRLKSIRMWVNKLPTRAAVLKWYLEINAGGTPHSREEIERVTELYRAETNPPNPR